MLREVDLNKNLTKNEYKEMMDKLAPKFAALQREARAKGLPVMVVFEGWGASGKGTMISRLIQPLDPRGFKVFTIQADRFLRAYASVFVAFLDEDTGEGAHAYL